MDYTKIIIRNENLEDPLFPPMLTDDHIRHLINHIPYIWKPNIFKHCIEHVKLHRKRKSMGVPIIEVGEIIRNRSSSGIVKKS